MWGGLSAVVSVVVAVTVLPQVVVVVVVPFWPFSLTAESSSRGILDLPVLGIWLSFEALARSRSRRRVAVKILK
ncbi:hypothetical protein E2C01_049699 [Portunus trituberculatus]|uniref:Uncharacterized protein n=1 Tax=Portunus trituberculatus TaxID=210409 RepID=A0A5B7GED4_PORTR|nr:hypothetical protein [Portunus trituberculatus]